MQAKDSPQHFLDTSVVRSLLLGTQAYRQYLNSNLAERPLYISNYIQMEIKRSYLMKIGDAVIALNAPRQMQLEHTDNSFDYLCPPIEQPHNKHPSENQVLTDSSG
ncbi:MAG: hypothetical protein RLP02_04380 [Coleofasciculus sp. C2-GNP5-27]